MSFSNSEMFTILLITTHEGEYCENILANAFWQTSSLSHFLQDTVLHVIFFVQWLWSEHSLRSTSKKPELIPWSLHSATFFSALIKGYVVIREVWEHIKGLSYSLAVEKKDTNDIALLLTPLGERTVTDLATSLPVSKWSFNKELLFFLKNKPK